MARVLYDQDCGVCLRSVQWLQRHDRKGRIEPVPTDDDARQAVLDAAGVKARGKDTVVVEDAKGTWIKSTAMLRSLHALGGRWRVVAAMLWLVPRPLRHWGYDWFARNRHRFKGT